MQFFPFGNNVVIKPAERISQTESGLTIQEAERKMVSNPTKGTVVAVGPDCDHVRVGNNVYFDKYKIAELDADDGETLVSISEDDIGGSYLSPHSSHAEEHSV